MTAMRATPVAGWTFQNLSVKMTHVTASEQDWQRLGTYVTRRRNELGLTQSQVQARGGPSIATVRNIELAVKDSYRDGNLRALERALDWPAGAVDRILAGGEPDDTATGDTNDDSADAQFTAAIALLRAIRDNPNRSRPLRAMASAQLEQLTAILAADKAEEEQRSSQAS
ncbi:hypothetical protein ACGFIY_21005 [Micromonospora chersina]|uniref:hypothetical protein n=1 Tax=Micromonospora chersina TaxID=47854 RepID=UPI0037186CE3